MRLNSLNRAVILSGVLLVKASEDVARVKDDVIEKRIEENADALSMLHLEKDSKHEKFLTRAFSDLKTLITLDYPISLNPNMPLDISDDSKEKLKEIGRKDLKSTSFVENDGDNLLKSSNEADTWLKELLNTSFFDERLLTAENRKKAPVSDIYTSRDIQNEVICSYILSTEHPKGVLMPLRDIILTRFEAIGAESSVISKIDDCLKTIIQSLGEASEKASIYFSRSNMLMWKKNIQTLLTHTGVEENKPDLAQSASEILPKKSEEGPILDHKSLEILKTELKGSYSENIRPAIDEILSYYYLFLYVSINNAGENKLSDEDATVYYDLRDCIRSLDCISLLLCGILEIIRKEDINLKSHMVWGLDYKIFKRFSELDLLFSIKELHQENGHNTLNIDLIKALEKFNGFKNCYTQSLIVFQDDQDLANKWQKILHGYGFIIGFLADHLLYITYNVTEETLKKMSGSGNPVKNENPVETSD